MEEKKIYGKEIADRINEQTIQFIEKCKLNHQRIPKLAVLLVGNSPASLSYVAGFEKICAKVGMLYELITMDENISEEELIQVVQKCNQEKTIDGILIQMPLPKHIHSDKVIEALDPKKDVDGFHPMNVGKLVMGQDAFVPCTALSAMAFIEEADVDLKGKEVVILGRSNVIGKPAAHLCLAKHATVTVCHSRTQHIEQVCQRADVVIAAMGQAKLVNEKWIKEGAVVIDVGVNRDSDGKLCGDVDLERVIDRVSRISPVPKGVGVVTNAMLLQNAIKAYQMKGE